MTDTENRQYNFIDNTVKIDFSLPRGITNMMERCEQADLEGDYGTYNNFTVYFLYTLCKEAYVLGNITKKQWETLERRFLL